LRKNHLCEGVKASEHRWEKRVALVARNLADRCKMTCQWLFIRQNRNRK